nr:7897_t:CDS:2 [Entrophospora candida]
MSVGELRHAESEVKKVLQNEYNIIGLLETCNHGFILICPPFVGYTATSETGVSREDWEIRFADIVPFTKNIVESTTKFIIQIRRVNEHSNFDNFRAHYYGALEKPAQRSYPIFNNIFKHHD